MSVDLTHALEWLDSHINYESIDLTKYEDRSIGNIGALLEVMGNPEKSAPVIHVTGTNGKSSTSRMIAQLLTESGVSTGLFTSPHLQKINERWHINMIPVSDHDLADALYAIELLEPIVEKKLTYFEILTAAAFWLFDDRGLDAVVLEVGIGGTWDCTNVADADVAVITNVGLDHQAILGNTRELIAKEKSGIIKPHSKVVLAETDEHLLSIFNGRIAEVNAETPWIFGNDFGITRNDIAVGGRFFDSYTPLGKVEDIFLPLYGSHQTKNAVTAIAAVDAFRQVQLEPQIVREAFQATTSPGRLEVVSRKPLLIIDGAHNQAGARASAKALKEEFSSLQKYVVIMGVLDGREPIDLLKELEMPVKLVIATRPNNQRARDSQSVVEAAESLGVPAKIVDDLEGAIKIARSEVGDDEAILIWGSLYLVGAARNILVD